MPSITIVSTAAGQRIIAILVNTKLDEEQLLLIYVMASASGLAIATPERAKDLKCWGAFVSPEFTDAMRSWGQTLIFSKK